MKARIAAITLFILFFNMLGLLPQMALADSFALAELSEVKGEVWVHRGGGLQGLAGYNGMGLYQGDSLRTGANGTVKISYGDGTETTVGTNTRLTMQQLSSDTSVSQAGSFKISASSKKIGIFLWTGSIWNKVKRFLNNDDQYEVETPTAIMGVRGTLYLVNVNRQSGATTGEVLEGTVAFRQNRERTNAGMERLVTMGEELEIFSLQAPLSAQKEINGEKLIETSEPAIIAAMITDVTERAGEIKEQAKAAQSDFEQTKDTEKFQDALEFAEKAVQLSDLTKVITDQAAGSGKAEQINEVLKEKNKTLDQVQSSVEQIKQDTRQTQEDVVETAKDTGLSEEEIEDIVEEIKDIIKEPEEPAKKPVDPKPAAPNKDDLPESGKGGTDQSTPINNRKEK